MNFIKKLLKRTFIYKIHQKRVEKRRQKFVSSKIPSFRKECDDLFQLFCNSLNCESIVFWPEFGTLLGCYREHDFIAHDFDIDMAAFLRDAVQVRRTLEKNGFKMIRHYVTPYEGSREECYEHPNYKTSIDVFYFTELDNVMFCDCFGTIVNMNKKKNLNKYVPFSVRRIIFPLDTFVESTFKGVKIYLPKNIEEHLMASYGESFMVPDPNFKPLERSNIRNYSYQEKPAVGLLTKRYCD